MLKMFYSQFRTKFDWQVVLPMALFNLLVILSVVIMFTGVIGGVHA